MASDAEISVVASLLADVQDFVDKFNKDVPESVRAGMETAQAAVQKGADGVTAALNEVAERANEAGGKAGEAFGVALGENAHASGKEAGEKSAEGINEAAERHREAGEESGKSFGEGLLLIAAAIATTFLDKLHEAFGEATEMAEDLKNAVTQTGDSVEGVQKLNYAFATFGVSGEEATRSIVMFQRKLEEAGQKMDGKSIFERAGLDPKAMANNPASKNIELIADKMRGLSTAAERSDLAMASFGRAGLKLIPILTEGGPAMRELEESADKAGAVLGGEDVDALDELREKMNQLGQTSKVFFASFVAPFAGAAKAITQAIQDIYAAFERLSKDDKLAVIFGAIATAAALAEKGLQAFKPILGSLVGKEVSESLLEVSAFIGRLVPIVGILAIAWAKDFGGMKEFVDRVLLAVGTFGKNAKAAFDEISASAKSILGPSLEKLSEAFNRLLIGLGDLIQAVADNGAVFSLLEAAAGGVLNVLNTLIQIVTSIINLFKDGMGQAITGVAVILAGVFLDAIVAAGAAVVGFITEEIIGNVIAFGNAILDLIPKIQAMFFAWIAGEDIAFPPLLIVQGLLIAIGIAVMVVAANWKTLGPIVYNVMAQIEDWVANVNEKLSEWLDWLAQLIATIPALGWLADIISRIAGNTQEAADAASNAAANYRALANAVSGAKAAGEGKAAPNSGSFGTYEPVEKKKESGEEHLLPLPEKAKKDKKGGSEANTAALDALKQSLEPYEEAIRKTQLLLSQLEVKQQELGKIDTWAKVVAQSSIYNQQIAATILLEAQERAEGLKDLQLRKEALALAAKQKDPKEKRKDQEQANTYQKDADNAALKASQEEVKRLKLKADKTSAPVEFEKTQAADSDLPVSVRLAAVNDEIWRTLQKEIVSKGALANRTSELAKLEKTRLDIMAEQAKLQNDLTNSKYDEIKAKVDAAAAIRNATPIGNDPTGAKTQQRAEADASDEVTKATIDAAAKTQALSIAQQQLTEADKAAAAGHAVSANEYLTLQTSLNQATAAQTTADAALTVATMKLAESQKTVDPTMKTLQSSLASMAQQVAGPLMDAFKLIETGTNPLVALFSTLFTKSKAFQDIMTIMGKVVDAVAQIFDAMRPVIDLLLGVVVGLVNVFLTMYNVIVTLLNVLGLHIEKIKLVTDSLDGMNGAVPLLQVTHDLPTMNEINSGKMADLKAQQNNINNDMNTGFNAGLSKIGTILGTLLGMYALMKVFGGLIGGKGIGSGFSSVIDQVKSLFGIKTSTPNTITPPTFTPTPDSQYGPTFTPGLTGPITDNSGIGGTNSSAGANIGGQTPGAQPGGFLPDNSGGGDPADIGAAIADGIQTNSSSALNVMTATPPSASVLSTSTGNLDTSSNLGTSVAATSSSSNLGVMTTAPSSNSLIAMLTGSGGIGLLASLFGGGGSSGGFGGIISGLLGGGGSGGIGGLLSGLIGGGSGGGLSNILSSFLGGSSLSSGGGGSGLSGLLGSFLGSGSGSTSGLSGIFKAFSSTPIAASVASTDLEGGASAMYGSTTAATRVAGAGIGGALEGGAGMIGGLISSLLGGNAQDSSALSTIGGMVGMIGGPLGVALGSGLGAIIGGFFGPKAPTVDKNPDETNAQINGEAYGQAIANLQGEAVTANGQSYQNQTASILQSISSYIAGGGKGLSAALTKEFTGATGIINGKNGILDLSNGVNEQWQTLVNDANKAMSAITGAGGNMATSLQSLLAGATSVNLAALFGNGTSVTKGGSGYFVNGGGNSNLNSTSAPFNINIAQMSGIDKNSVKDTFQSLFDEYGRQQQIVARTQASMQGRGY